MVDINEAIRQTRIEERDPGAESGASIVLLQLTLKRFGNSRKGDLQQIDTDAEKALLKLSKRLLDCKEYKDIERHDQDSATWIRGRSIPSLFKPGIYRVMPERVEAIDGYLDQRLGERAELVKALVSVYQSGIDTAKGRLGTQFNALDYPPVGKLVSEFGLDWQFFTLGPPAQVEGITAGFVARETARLRDIFERAEAEGLALVREEFAGLVERRKCDRCLFPELTQGDPGADTDGDDLPVTVKGRRVYQAGLDFT